MRSRSMWHFDMNRFKPAYAAPFKLRNSKCCSVSSLTERTLTFHQAILCYYPTHSGDSQLVKPWQFSLAFCHVYIDTLRFPCKIFSKNNDFEKKYHQTIKNMPTWPGGKGVNTVYFTVISKRWWCSWKSPWRSWWSHLWTTKLWRWWIEVGL